MQKKRVALLGISYEALLRSPVPSDTMAIYRGTSLLQEDLWLVRGIRARLLEEQDIEIVPLLWATALPGGGLTQQVYAKVKEEVVALLQANGPFDGAVLANHGAMEVRGLDKHADTDFVEAVRSALGPEAVVTVALDLHGHITPRMLEVVDAVSALRTAPHRDDRETGYRAAELLVRILRTGVRPRIAAVRIPILVPGEQSVTTAPPAKELYALLPEIDARPGILDANILIGFAWNDCPWGGMTAYVTAENDAALATSYAQQLAQAIWDRREDFILRMETATVAEGLKRAAALERRPVFLSDSGDNTTAGSYGDLTGVLQAVLDEPALDDVVVAGITAPEAVATCREAGVGAVVTLVLGSEHRSAARTSRTVKALVEAFDTELRPHDGRTYLRERPAWARVRIGSTIVTFTAASIGMVTPAHFLAMGIDSSQHKVCVVKLGYLHPHLEDIAAHAILLLSEGSSNLDLRRLSWSRVPRPAWPLDSQNSWTPGPSTYTSPN